MPSCNNKKQQLSAEKLFEKGIIAAKKKNYQSCIFNLGKVDEIAPYSPESKKSKPVLIFCHYMMREYDTVETEIQSYESLYPTSSEIPYLYYINALSHFREIKTHKKAQDAVQKFKVTAEKVFEKAPNSQYAQNLHLLYTFILEIEEAHKMYIAQNYLLDRNFISAVPRLIEIHENTESPATKQQTYHKITKLIEHFSK